MKFKFSYFNHRTGYESIIEVPGKRCLCPECNGSGMVLMDGLRGEVFSFEELFIDGFGRAYMNGEYDVLCDFCKGEKVTIEPDESQMTRRQMILWRRMRDLMEYDLAEAKHERLLRDAGIEY